MSKAYVVMQTSWEYNDEYYYTTDDSAGQAKKVFLDKAKAEALAKELFGSPPNVSPGPPPNRSLRRCQHEQSLCPVMNYMEER